MTKPLFIAFEGIDGSGKSTQVKLLSDHLEGKGHRIYRTAEPTDRPIGKMIRQIFAGKQEADHRVIAALFAADRLDHLLNQEDGVLRKLSEGFTVICDRYYLSSYAYHGVHMPLDWVIETNRLAAQTLRPDIHLFLEIDPETCMDRIRRSRQTTELYETLSNLKRVRDKYMEAITLVEKEERISIIKTRETPENTAADIRAALSTAGLI